MRSNDRAAKPRVDWGWVRWNIRHPLIDAKWWKPFRPYVVRWTGLEHHDCRRWYFNGTTTNCTSCGREFGHG